jgi:hypothetical protein
MNTPNMPQSDEQFQVEIGRAVTAELESLPDLGTDINEGGFLARAGNRPIAHRLSDIFAALGTPIDSSAVRLYERFQVLVVPHRVSIMRTSGMAEPTSVGIEIEYLADGATCCVIGLLPSFEYVEHGSVGVGIDTSISGSISPTGELGDLAELVSAHGGDALKLGSLSCTLSGGVSAKLNFKANVATPSVAAVGIGSDRAQWRINRQKEPLFGRDIETWSILVVPVDFEELKYRIRFSLMTRTLFFPTRRESDWMEVSCVFGHREADRSAAAQSNA